MTIFPGNSGRGLPSVLGTYLLLDGATGAPLAAIDGTRLTLWRTAAASALAGRSLVRPGASRMLMVGAGALAPFLIRAHAAEHGRSPTSRCGTTGRSGPQRWRRDCPRQGLPVRAATDLRTEVGKADIVSCATLTSDPLVQGEWLRPGTHLDCVGAFKPSMRETDDACVRAATLFCDTRAGALKEGGDYAQPIAAGVIAESDVKGDLYDLSRGAHAGRSRADEITMFKSVGTAIEDLAAAILVWRRVR